MYDDPKQAAIENLICRHVPTLPGDSSVYVGYCLVQKVTLLLSSLSSGGWAAINKCFTMFTCIFYINMYAF